MGKYLKSIISFARLTSCQRKDQPLRLYRANQHGLPLDSMIMRELVTESWSK